MNTATKTKSGYDMSPAKAMAVYEKHLQRAHHGRMLVNNVLRRDNGDVVAFTRIDKDLWKREFVEQRVAFFDKDGNCKWDMIS
jgi:hypothetical protein